MYEFIKVITPRGTSTSLIGLRDVCVQYVDGFRDIGRKRNTCLLNIIKILIEKNNTGNILSRKKTVFTINNNILLFFEIKK